MVVILCYTYTVSEICQIITCRSRDDKMYLTLSHGESQNFNWSTRETSFFGLKDGSLKEQKDSEGGIREMGRRGRGGIAFLLMNTLRSPPFPCL